MILKSRWQPLESADGQTGEQSEATPQTEPAADSLETPTEVEATTVPEDAAATGVEAETVDAPAETETQEEPAAPEAAGADADLELKIDEVPEGE